MGRASSTIGGGRGTHGVGEGLPDPFGIEGPLPLPQRPDRPLESAGFRHVPAATDVLQVVVEGVVQRAAQLDRRSGGQGLGERPLRARGRGIEDERLLLGACGHGGEGGQDDQDDDESSARNAHEASFRAGE